jgi:hypothetical protein
MKPTSVLIAISSLALLAACSSESSGNQTTPPPEWKTVTKMENGISMSYQVPANTRVPGGAAVSKFDTTPTQANAAAAAPAPSPAQPNVGGPPISTRSSLAASSPISEDAEVAIGQAEIMVRDLQTRYETAQTALNSARRAAEHGDSVSVLKYSKTAMALTRPSN